jgi:hypothetical protein
MLHESAADSTAKEREPRFAACILAHYPPGAGEVLLIASNGGRSAVPIELALEARAKGARMVGITTSPSPERDLPGVPAGNDCSSSPTRSSTTAGWTATPWFRFQGCPLPPDPCRRSRAP